MSIRTIDCSGRTQVIYGNLEEMGEWSALLLLEAPVAQGTHVTVNAESGRLTGQVHSWSWEPELGYFVDVQLDAESRWSADWFQPQHFVAVPDGLRQQQPEYRPRSAAA
ncbi:MAG TPA: hypothetical protein VM120_28930 [Bryobacteraceae bacterium]|nr:hypothetical protein [Bryobacteraceae bacterium]